MRHGLGSWCWVLGCIGMLGCASGGGVEAGSSDEDLPGAAAHTHQDAPAEQDRDAGLAPDVDAGPGTTPTDPPDSGTAPTQPVTDAGVPTEDALPTPPTYPPVWTEVTSDGNYPKASCRGFLSDDDARPMSGLRCEGRYCDNVQALCEGRGDLAATNVADHPWFSEEQEAFACPADQWVTGMRCSGKYCDSMSLECATLETKDGPIARRRCYFAPALSEETRGSGPDGSMLFPEGFYLAGLGCEGDYCDGLRPYLCRMEGALPQVDMETLVHRFAPRLRFDQEFGTGSGKNSKCFPSDPADYFENVSKRAGSGTDEVLAACNMDYRSIEAGSVPTFYVHDRVGPSLIAIDYWVFYAMQSYCASQVIKVGYHAADWEHVTVLLRQDVHGEYRLERVAFHQHGGWYTRNRGEFELHDGTHPVAYVGKNSHGMYETSGGSGGCLYFADYRNPGAVDMHMDTSRNLVPLRRDNQAPEWMRCDGSWTLPGLDGHCFSSDSSPPHSQAFGYGGCDGQSRLECHAERMKGCAKDGCGDRTQVNEQNAFASEPWDRDAVTLSANHSGLCVEPHMRRRDNGEPIVQAQCAVAEAQRLRLQRRGSGETIRVIESDRCVDIVNRSQEGGARAVQYDCHGESHQQFSMEADDRGLMLRAVHSGQCLDVAGTSADEGANLVQWPCHDGDNQRFTWRYGDVRG